MFQNGAPKEFNLISLQSESDRIEIQVKLFGAIGGGQLSPLLPPSPPTAPTAALRALGQPCKILEQGTAL